MKEIKAIVRQSRVAEVLQSLSAIEGLPGITISDIRGFGKSRNRYSPEKTADGDFMYVERTKLELVINDALVEDVVGAIQAAAHSGNTGDGKIFIIPVEDCIKIRTGERGAAAI